MATAGELSLTEAAEVASTALNAFKSDNLSVADAANQLAGAANASATDVHELKYGLSAVAAVALVLVCHLMTQLTLLQSLHKTALKALTLVHLLKQCF